MALYWKIEDPDRITMGLIDFVLHTMMSHKYLEDRPYLIKNKHIRKLIRKRPHPVPVHRSVQVDNRRIRNPAHSLNGSLTGPYLIRRSQDLTLDLLLKTTFTAVFFVVLCPLRGKLCPSIYGPWPCCLRETIQEGTKRNFHMYKHAMRKTENLSTEWQNNNNTGKNRDLQNSYGVQHGPGNKKYRDITKQPTEYFQLGELRGRAGSSRIFISLHERYEDTWFTPKLHDICRQDIISRFCWYTA